MNWKLILKLSVFGVAMGVLLVAGLFARVDEIEGVLWFLIFFVCVWSIVKYCTRFYFLHGFLTSLLMDIWITLILIVFFQTYLENDPKAASSFKTFGNPIEGELTYLFLLQLVAIIFGLFLGLFAQGFAYMLKKRRLRRVRSSS
jgi:ABC-type phosphate transport system permease subunit